MPKRVVFWVLAGMVVIVLAVVPVLWPSTPRQLKLQITANGFTNIAGHGEYAVFAATNMGDGAILCSPIAIEQHTQTGWVRSKTSNHYEWPGWIDSRWRIPPRQTLFLYVPPPSTPGTWRLDLVCWERQAGLKRVIMNASDRIRDHLRIYTEGYYGKTEERFGGPAYEFTTPEVVQ